MSLNDLSMRAQGTDVYPGVANPTASSNISDPLQTNFVTDPTLEDKGAGAGPTFEGDKQATRGFKQTAGVIEGRPGIIESAGIDPLNENSNKDDGWANATSHPTTERGPGIADRASNAADAVKEAVFGK